MMIAGLAFATGCMTCFGSALVVGMVVYIGLAQSASLWRCGAVSLLARHGCSARHRSRGDGQSACRSCMKLETAVPWMGLTSAVIMAGFGVLLLSGNYMVVAEWSQRLASVAASLPNISQAGSL